MVVNTAANSAQPRTCGLCGSSQTIHIRMVPVSNRYWRKLMWPPLVNMRGLVMKVWNCADCGAVEDAKTKWPPPADEVRPEIVTAIKRLKAAGHRFFDWEK